LLKKKFSFAVETNLNNFFYFLSNQIKQVQILSKLNQQNLGIPDNKSQEISNELNKTPNNNSNNNSNKLLENSEQNQTPNSTKDNHNSQESKDNSSPKKKKNKKKKKQQQQLDHQDKNGKKEEEGEKGVLIIYDDVKKVQEIVDTATKLNNKKDDNSSSNSPKKKKSKKKSSINNINSNDNKIEESKKDSDVGDFVDAASTDVIRFIIGSSEVQSVRTEKTIETPKKESNIENLDKSSSNKKKKKENNGTDDKQSDETKKSSIDQSVESFVGIMKKEYSDKKDKKRKSVEFILPGQNEHETSTKKKQRINKDIGKTKDKKKSKIGHENDTHSLTNYHENIPAAIKKIFKSNKVRFILLV